MIEKAQRPIRRERREPQRQSRELHRHRIQIDPVETPFGDRATDRRALRLADVGGMTAARADERRFVRGREISARGDEKRTAAHRRIDDPQLQDPFGRGIDHEGAECAANQIIGDRLRRVEAAGCFSEAGSANQRDAATLDARLVIEQRLVDGAELFDAEIAIGEAFATGAIRRWPRRQREQRAPRRLVIQPAALRKWRS